jgi:hypothetical protein
MLPHLDGQALPRLDLEQCRSSRRTAFASSLAHSPASRAGRCRRIESIAALAHDLVRVRHRPSVEHSFESHARVSR